MNLVDCSFVFVYLMVLTYRFGSDFLGQDPGVPTVLKHFPDELRSDIMRKEDSPAMILPPDSHEKMKQIRRLRLSLASPSMSRLSSDDIGRG